MFRETRTLKSVFSGISRNFKKVKLEEKIVQIYRQVNTNVFIHDRRSRDKSHKDDLFFNKNLTPPFSFEVGAGGEVYSHEQRFADFFLFCFLYFDTFVIRFLAINTLKCVIIKKLRLLIVL